jgi:hypothetical protein
LHKQGWQGFEQQPIGKFNNTLPKSELELHDFVAIVTLQDRLLNSVLTPVGDYP